MLNLTSAIERFTGWQPLWMLDDTETDDIPEFVEGELVEFDDYYGDYIGCGIIKRLTIAEFKNPQTGTFEMLPCAIIVSANPDAQFLDYVPMHCIDPLSLNDYVQIYEAEYGELSQDARLQLRVRIAARMSQYSRVGNLGTMPRLQETKASVSLQANTGAIA